MANHELAQECQSRLVGFQAVCGAWMQDKRGVIDDESFDMLSRAYSLTGNAAREMGLLLKEIKELTSQSTEE